MHRLLIVDDETEIVDWLYELFSELPELELEVYKALSGFEALEILESADIDVVISDIKMPGMNGLQLLEKIKSSRPSCRVIFLTGYNEFDYVYTAIKYDGVSYLLKIEEDSEIIKAVCKAVDELERSAENRKLMDKAPDYNAPEKNICEPIDRIKQYIKEHLGEELSLGRLAELSYFNPSYLSRLFKQATGQNIMDYISELRIEKAKCLLIERGRRISDISTALGFESQHYFSRFFKKHTGLTPQQYKESKIKM